MLERDEAQRQLEVRAAIERVLEAERAGEVAVEGARERARQVVAAAADEAARIAARARVRIAALRARCARAEQSEIARIEQSAATETLDRALGAGTQERLRRVVACVARELVSDVDGRDHGC